MQVDPFLNPSHTVRVGSKSRNIETSFVSIESHNAVEAGGERVCLLRILQQLWD